MQEIRLTPISFIVLGLLSWVETATPYELKQMATSLSDLWSVQHTQLYGEPARLAKAGYLTEQQEATGRRRKTYALTRKGGAALQDWLARPTTTLRCGSFGFSGRWYVPGLESRRKNALSPPRNPFASAP